MNDNNESCSIFDFVNAQFAQDSSKKKNYQDNPACYEFDSVNVIGKINAYSGTFFQNPIKNSIFARNQDFIFHSEIQA